MQRVTSIITICLLASFSCFAQKNVSKKNYKTIGSKLPPLKVVTLDEKTITNKDVNNHANLLVMLFNPVCEHCQYETELLEQNIKLFIKSKLLMVTAANMKSELSSFEHNSHTGNYMNTILIGLDSNGTIDKTFLYNSLPQINIYNRKRRLIKVFSGDTPIDSLRTYIQ
ncbi:MAG: hypothetical protein ACTHJ0_07340 [Flavipsychrobacter sp.]